MPAPDEGSTLINGLLHRDLSLISSMLTEADILTALRDCYDPALPCNVVDLGLVRKIRISPDPDAPGAAVPGVPQKHRISIELALTNPAEEASAQITAQIQNRLAGLEEAGETTVVILNEPPWTPQQITPAGRRILGLDGNPNLVQIR
jgi:metal-sulfur cluster biosynthetic enzyme